MADDRKDKENDSAAVGNRLTAFLMGQADIEIDAKSVEDHPRYTDFRRAAERVIKFLGGEDYLSLVAALDAEDEGTLLHLVRKANQNRRTETTEARIVPIGQSRVSDRDLLGRQGFSHAVKVARRDLREGFMDHLDRLDVHYQFDPDGTFFLDLRTGTATRSISAYLREAAHTPVSRMVQHGLFVDWIGHRLPEDLHEEDAKPDPADRWYHVAYTDRDGQDSEKIVAVRERDAQTAISRATRHFKEKSKYDIADYEVEVRPGGTPDPKSDRFIAVLETQATKGKHTMRHKRPVTETVMGMTNMPPLQRMRELAGISDDLDRDFTTEAAPDLAGSHLSPGLSFERDPDIDVDVDVEDDFDDEPDIEISTVTAAKPTLVKPARPAAPAVAGDVSEEFRQASEALDRALVLVMNMKISEYMLFCERAADFCEDVQDIGRKINQE